MAKLFLLIGSISATLSVALGAFGAHGLKKMIPMDRLDIFETGIRYQFYHSFALLILGLLLTKFNARLLPAAGWAFLIGIIFFSGSLYLLALRDVLGIASWKWLGPITPIGGLAFIVGWSIMAIAIIKS